MWVKERASSVNSRRTHHDLDPNRVLPGRLARRGGISSRMRSELRRASGRELKELFCQQFHGQHADGWVLVNHVQVKQAVQAMMAPLVVSAGAILARCRRTVGRFNNSTLRASSCIRFGHRTTLRTTPTVCGHGRWLVMVVEVAFWLA